MVKRPEEETAPSGKKRAMVRQTSRADKSSLVKRLALEGSTPAAIQQAFLCSSTAGESRPFSSGGTAATSVVLGGSFVPVRFPTHRYLDIGFVLSGPGRPENSEACWKRTSAVAIPQSGRSATVILVSLGVLGAGYYCPPGPMLLNSPRPSEQLRVNLDVQGEFVPRDHSPSSRL
jgi:hypothetical protein